MAFSFGDGFDLYTGQNDPVGYWDVTGNNTGSLGWLNPGRFAGSRALQMYGTSNLVKTSGVNDAVHHIVVSYMQGSAVSGSSLGNYFQLLDGTTGQCAIVFRSDGAILLQSGNVGGTTLATYPGAFAAANTWYSFECEVVINNTTGRFRVRRNGNAVDDYDSGATLNTRVSANNYANKLYVGMQTIVSGNQNIDDLFWRSDASSVAWMGDIKCSTRYPVSDQSVQFSRTPASATPAMPGVSSSSGGGFAFYAPIVAAFDGTVGTLALTMNVGFTGNLKCSVFNDAANSPGTVRSSATTIVNPISGVNNFTFPTPFTVTKGTRYWVGVINDTGTGGAYSVGSGSGFYASSVTYAAFPVSSPAMAGGNPPIVFTWTITVGTNNTLVNEPQQDAATSYVYDSTPGDADFYGIAAITSTPVSTIAVTTRGYMQKSDAGTRTAAVQLKSGGTTVASPTLTLTTSGWQWAWRTDIVDPNVPGAPTTWNPANLSSVTLSGGNLTATSAASTSWVKGAAAKLAGAGKFYWEVTPTVWASGNSAHGFGPSALSSPSGSSMSGWSGIDRAGNLYMNGFAGITLTGVSGPGVTIGIALDLISNLVWYRVAPSGNWNNSSTANPATGTGGISVSSIAGVDALPIAAFGIASDAVTANFGASSFSGTVPSGFTAGFTGTAPAWTAAAVNNANVGVTVVA